MVEVVVSFIQTDIIQPFASWTVRVRSQQTTYRWFKAQILRVQYKQPTANSH